MNYGLTAAAVLGVLALSAPKEPQHNLMKLPSFKGILEVRASIPGRMRLYVPSLSGSMDQAEQARASTASRKAAWKAVCTRFWMQWIAALWARPTA